jgi:multidrug resistance protein, MATE family
MVCCSNNANDILLNYDPGTARGVGWQKIGAYVNLGSYYLVGIPAAVVLAFVLHVGGKVNKYRPFFHKNC